MRPACSMTMSSPSRPTQTCLPMSSGGMAKRRPRKEMVASRRTRTWQVVGRGHGTVTRDPAHRIDERFTVASCPCQLHDNFLRIEVAGTDLSEDEGWQRAGIALRRLLLAKSALLGEAIRAKLVRALDGGGNRLKHSARVQLGAGRLYHLDGLRSEVRRASQQAELQDDARLRRALVDCTPGPGQNGARCSIL